ncbi:MAG: sigma-70 family RNA polymerase sigma factor [Ruminiclostridium sp.]|nr:sigma-70 family RNA polymerase sigma factor [Ruminiclostridium sp.]
MKDIDELLWFQELYLRFSKPLVQLSCRAGIELEISKEIMQQAFYYLLVNYDELKVWHPNLIGWLIKTNSNLIKKELGSARRKHEIPLADWLDAPTEDHYHFPLRDILPAGLSERHKEILALCYEDQLSYREIAARMNITEGYVGVLLGRARQEFKKLYESENTRFGRGISFFS